MSTPATYTHFIPLQRILDHVNASRETSDSDYLHSLIKASEFVTKIVVLSSIASLKPDKYDHGYKFRYEIVRAGGIGEWSNVMNQIYSGRHQFQYSEDYSNEQDELYKVSKTGEWQFECLTKCQECINIINNRKDKLNEYTLIAFFRFITEIRNSNFHWRIPNQKYIYLSIALQSAINIFIENFSLFKRQWFYWHNHYGSRTSLVSLRNIREEKSREAFEKQKLKTGIYFFTTRPIHVELFDTYYDLSDFYIPNGKWNDKRFESISLLTGTTKEMDAKPYLSSPESRLSETHGKLQLETLDNCLTNIPLIKRIYVKRNELESRLEELLLDRNRSRLITLHGSGGVGKTSLTIEVLKSILKKNRYQAIIWFSSRDIDLNQSGATVVQPRIVTRKDIAREYANLLGVPTKEQKSRFDPNQFFQEELVKSTFESTLFVFDNFETIHNPLEVYEWLEKFIGHPNKVLITTRHREFYADNPIEVLGMSKVEFNELVDSISKEYHIEEIMDVKNREFLFAETGGHPYMVKVLLGEVADTKKFNRSIRLYDDKERILDALFEKTFDRLSLFARRIFLTLCNWRSLIPEAAVEAVFECITNNDLDGEGFGETVENALRDLRTFSLIEIVNPKAEFRFINVPLTASNFGLSKLKVYPNRSLYEADTRILMEFGASQVFQISEGIEPRLHYFIKNAIAKKPKKKEFQLRINMLESIATKYADTYILLADMFSELNEMDQVKKYLNEYLRKSNADSKKQEVWLRMANIHYGDRQFGLEIEALISRCECQLLELQIYCDVARKVTFYLKENKISSLKTPAKNIILLKLINLIESHPDFRKELISATQYSALGWLYINQGNKLKGLECAKAGNTKDPSNSYCTEIINRLSIGSH